MHVAGVIRGWGDNKNDKRDGGEKQGEAGFEVAHEVAVAGNWW